MPVKLRLKRQGRRKAPHYAIVAADSRSPRDGRFIEKIGTYDPVKRPARVYLDNEAAIKWLSNGAQPTHTVRSLLRHAGVTLKYALIKQGKTEEEIERIFSRWQDEKRSKKVKKMVSVDVHGRLLESAGEIKEPTKKQEAPAPVTEISAPAGEAQEEADPVPVAEAPAEEAAAVVEEAVEEAAAPAEEVAAVVEEAATETEAPAPEAEAPAAVEEAAPEADDLKKIEGIGPKIAELLSEAGITTFAQLGATDTDKIKEVLAAAGDRFNVHDPETWPQQATMAAEGKWDELKKWQDELDGGKVAAPAEEAGDSE